MNKKYEVPNYKKLKAELKKIEEDAINNFPFKIGDVVSWYDRNYKKEVIGRITYIGFDSEMGRVWAEIKHNTIRDIGWSSNITYFYNDGTIKLKKIKFNPDEIKTSIETLDMEIFKINKKIQDMIHPLEKKVKEIQRKIQKLQNQCIHQWDKGIDTNVKLTEYITKMKYTCQICGAEGRN